MNIAASAPVPDLWANEGEKITCTNGHFICEVARDIKRDDIQEPTKDFRNWWPGMQATDFIGETDIRCPQCEALWFQDGWRVHFENGWR